MAYTIAAARQSEVFDKVLVSTESETIAEIAKHYGAEVPFLRPPEMAEDHSPDIQWLKYTLRELEGQGRSYSAFAILRPTSPFRLPSTIQSAWKLFRQNPSADSLRAVERCKQHPGKMWVIRENRLLPLLPLGPPEQPWHSSPTQSLPAVYVQNASLEICWSQVALKRGSIAGETIIPFLTEDWQGFDINDGQDFEAAERALSEGRAVVPNIDEEPFSGA